MKQFWCKNLPNLVYQKLKMQFAFFFLHISRKLCGRLRLQFNRSINMVGFSTGPQKETQLRRPGCIHGVKQMEIKWESCLIINHENRVLKLHRRETWTIAARNRRRSYSITGVFWGAAFHIQASPPPSPPSSPSPAVSDVHKVRLSRNSWGIQSFNHIEEKKVCLQN